MLERLYENIHKHSWQFSQLTTFRLELYGDWTGLIATSKGIAGLILDVDRDENSDYDEDDREFLKTLFKPFLAFAAKAQEATYQIGG